MKKIVALILALVLCLSLVACSSSSEETKAADETAAETVADAVENAASEGKKLTVAYSAIAYSIAVLPKAMQDNLEAECKDRGWDFIALAAEGDAEKQGEQIAQLIDQEPDAFVLFPADPVLADDWVKTISDAGIPVICMWTDVSTAQDLVECYVGPDNYAMGYNLAQAVIDKNGADAGLKLVRIGGVPVQSDYIARNQGVEDCIKENSNYEILGDVAWAFSSRADAQGLMEDFISAYGDDIDVLIGLDDDLTLGGVNALQEAGMKDVQVYSITGQKEALAAIEAGTMTLTASYTTKETASIVASALDKIAAGEHVDEYNQYITVTNITADNVAGVEGEF